MGGKDVLDKMEEEEKTDGATIEEQNDFIRM